MGKPKLEKFAAIAQMKNVFEKDPSIKDHWDSFFQHKNPYVLELACGKGDYAIGMASILPAKNFIGVDIKGNRIFTAANTAQAKGLENIAFIRDQIDHIDQYFAPHSISEIWITFADPFPRKGDAKRRLTSPKFLALYKTILAHQGLIHLKTDSDLLYEYTLEVITSMGITPVKNYPDVYAMDKNHELYDIQTYYEKMHLKEGRTIKYLQFQIS